MTGALLRACLSLLLLLPLAVWPGGLLFPFVTTKGLALQGVTVVALLGLAACALAGPRRLLRWDGVATAFAVVLVSMTIAGLAAGRVERALLDDLERMAGAVTVACSLVALIVARRVAGTEEQRLRWLTAAAAVAIPVALVAALQWRDVQVPGLPHRGRPSATLGHPAYLASHGLFSLFAGVTVLLAARRWPLRIAAGAGAAAGLVCVILSEARSAALGLLAGALAVLILRGVRAPGGGRERRTIQWVISAAVLVLAALIVVAKSPWADVVPIVRRVAPISLEGGTVATRLLVWDASVDAWLERPWLGWGPGLFPAAFEAHHPPGLLRFGLPETWFDDAHDIALNTLVEQGLLGAAALGALLVAVVRRSAFDASARADRLTATSVPLGFVVAHFVDKLFVFETVVSWVQLALFLGLAVPVSTVVRRPGPARRSVLSLALVGSAATLTLVALVPQARAARGARRAAALVAAGAAAAVNELDAAIAAAPDHAGEITRVLCATAAQTMPHLSPQRAQESLEAPARGLLDRQREHSDRPVRDALTRAYLVLSLRELRDDEALLQRTDAELRDAAQASPLRQEIALRRAAVLSGLRQPDEAERLLRRARDQDSTIALPWMWLIRHVARTRGAAPARRELAHARRAGIAFSPAEEAQIASWLAR